MKLITSGLDQSVQVQQIQQLVASGQKPAGFLIMSLAPEPVASSIKRLADIAPVLQIQNKPNEDELESVAFVGNNGDGNADRELTKSMVVVGRSEKEMDG